MSWSEATGQPGPGMRDGMDPLGAPRGDLAPDPVTPP